jgi:hypothetical protein
LDFGADIERQLAEMTETERHAAFKILTWAHNKANGAIARRFFISIGGAILPTPTVPSHFAADR